MAIDGRQKKKEQQTGLSRRDALKAIAVAGIALPVSLSLPKPSSANDDDYGHNRRKKRSQCDDDNSRDDGRSIDDGSATPPGQYGDWAVDGTEANKNMRLVFKTLSEHYGMSGSAAVAIIANTIRETGGSFNPTSAEAGAKFGDLNSPYPTEGRSALDTLYSGHAGGVGLWGFTPYTDFSESAWFKGDKAVNKSVGWSVENETAYLVEKELAAPGVYETFITFGYEIYSEGETGTYPGGTVYGVSRCDEKHETKPVRLPTYMTLYDFCMASDPVAAASDFYYANERGWRYDTCVPGATVHFGGRPITYPGIECYIPMLEKMLNTPRIAGDPSKIRSWVGGASGRAQVVSSSTTTREDDECLEDECEKLSDLASAGGLADVVMEAEQYIGCPYNWNGSYADGASFNCSGLVWWVFEKCGYSVPHAQCDPGSQAPNRGMIDKVYANCGGSLRQQAGLQPGDVVFFSASDGSRESGHVGIYIGGGQMIDSIPSGGVQKRALYGSFIGGGPLVSSSQPAGSGPAKKCGTALTAGMTELRQKAVETALGMVGGSYMWGLEYPETGYKGTDCNGLTYYCWNTVCGVSLAYGSGTNGWGQYQQMSATPGWKTRVEDLVAGDVCFFDTMGGNHHVGLYIGNYELVHAWGTRERGGTIIRSSIYQAGIFQGGACPEGQV